MPLALGTRVGPYEVLAKLGEGGMGEVYRARDTKLNRDVALKILPELFASDPERLARFKREAQVLASLNHPNIGAIFGIEDGGTPIALVMELVDGQTLADRMTAPVPVSEVIAMARQVADALDAAHEAGIVHRDLKPANVKVREDGTVKVLDFGLAKAPASDTSAADPMNSPTLTARSTQLGMILGTAAYMAPEQAKGRRVDKRADIWAFGVVLYEMLSGRRAFEGEDVSETMAAVLTRDLDFGALPAATPRPLVMLIRRCLERDPKRRLRDIGEARIVLDGPMTDMPVAAPATVASSRSVTIWRAVAAVLALGLIVVVALQWPRSTPSSAGVVSRSAILLPRGVTFDTGIFAVIAVSRDGSTMALIGSTAGVRRMYVRRLGEFELRLLDGTQDASSPFFSPDGKWIGFFAEAKLKKVSAAGGPVIPLADAPDNRGGVWADDDTIIFTPAAATPVFRVPANGGEAKAISTLDEKKRERTHRWPALLPDGKTVIVTVGSIEFPDDYDDATLESIRLDTGARSVVVQGGRAARFAKTGHLLFVQGKILFAVTFDPATGVAGSTKVPVIDGMSGDVTTGAAHYAISESGSIVYVPGDSGGERKLAWVDRKGAVTAIDLPNAPYSDPHLRTDGRYFAIAINADRSMRDIHVIDMVRGAPSRLTSGGVNRTPLWLDDRRVIYVTYDRVRNTSTVMRRLVDGMDTPEALTEISGQAYVDDVTSDGQTALLSLQASTPGSRAGVFKLTVQKGAKPELIASSVTGDVSTSSLSRDRKWVAYVSNESGRYEVYVQPFVAGGSRMRVSTVGGFEPRWAPDGRTLFYTQADSLMSVPLEPGAVFSPGKPVRVGGGVTLPLTDSAQTYTLAPNGDRFLMLRSVHEDLGPAEARIVLNWFDELRAVKTGK